MAHYTNLVIQYLHQSLGLKQTNIFNNHTQKFPCTKTCRPENIEPLLGYMGTKYQVLIILFLLFFIQYWRSYTQFLSKKSKIKKLIICIIFSYYCNSFLFLVQIQLLCFNPSIERPFRLLLLLLFFMNYGQKEPGYTLLLRAERNGS